MDGFVANVWAEVMRLPWTALFGLIVATVVSTLLVVGIIVGFIADVHRFTQTRKSQGDHPRLEVRNDDVRERLTGHGAA